MKVVSDSSALYADFINHATNETGEFEGGLDFSNKIKKVISKAVQLKSGSKLLSELLNSGKPISIIRAEPGCCEVRIGKCMDLKEAALALNFEKKIYYWGLNKNGEMQFQKEPSVVIFLHEATHLKHLFENSEKVKDRYVKGSAIPFMDNQEEELTITGAIQDSEDKEPCSENSVLTELDLPLRMHHRGANELEKMSPIDRAKQAVTYAALADLRDVHWPENAEEAAAFSTEMLQICFAQMKYAWQVEKTPIIGSLYGSAYVGRWEEYEGILSLLVEKGGVPSAAFKNLIDSVETVYISEIHMKWMQIIGQFIQSGYANDEIFKKIICLARVNNGFEAKHNWLNLIARFATDFAAQDMMQIMEAFVQEKDPQVKKAWGEIILSASEQNNSKLLHGLIGNASRAEREEIKLQWLDLALERIDNAVCDAKGKKALKTSLRNAVDAEDLTERQKWLEIIRGLLKAGNSCEKQASYFEDILEYEDCEATKQKWLELSAYFVQP